MQTVELFLVVMLAALAVFQVLLAFGAPLGEASWGGKYKNTLPTKLRLGSALSALILVFMTSVVLSKSGFIDVYSDSLENILLGAMAVYFAIGVVMNAVSRSKIERIWSPYSAILCILCVWLLV